MTGQLKFVVRTGGMSGGEQQMCANGRELMALTEVLMFDEPPLGLSLILVQEVFEFRAAVSSPMAMDGQVPREPWMAGAADRPWSPVPLPHPRGRLDNSANASVW